MNDKHGNYGQWRTVTQKCQKCGREFVLGMGLVKLKYDLDWDLCEPCANELIQVIDMWFDGELDNMHTSDKEVVEPSPRILELSRMIVQLIGELNSQIYAEQQASKFKLRKRFSLCPLRGGRRALVFEFPGIEGRQREIANVEYFGGEWKAGYALDTLLCAMDYAGELK